MAGRRVRRKDAGNIRCKQLLQGLVNYYKELDFYSKGVEEPEQDLKQGRGSFAFSKGLFDFNVTIVQRRIMAVRLFPKPVG